MASAIIQEVSNYEANSATSSITITEPANNSVVIVVTAYELGQVGNTALTITTPSSVFTLAKEIYPSSGFDWSLAIFYKVSTGSGIGTTITSTHTGYLGGSHYIWMGEYTGISTTTPLDATCSGGSTGTNLTSPVTVACSSTGTLSQADCFVIGVWGSTQPASSGKVYSLPTLTEEDSNEAGAYDANIYIGTLDVSATTALTPTFVHTNGLLTRMGGVGAVFKLTTATTPPTNTVPVDTAGIFTTSASATDFGTISVASGSAQINSVTVAVPSGKGTLTFTANGAVVLTGNGTNSVVLDTSSSDAEYNTTLDSGTFTGAADVMEAVTVTVTTADGTFTDVDTFDLLNDPDSLTITVGTYAQLRACLQSMTAKLKTGELLETVTLLSTDPEGNFDTTNFTLYIPVPESTPTVEVQGLSANKVVRTRRIR